MQILAQSCQWQQFRSTINTLNITKSRHGALCLPQSSYVTLVFRPHLQAKTNRIKIKFIQGTLSLGFHRTVVCLIENQVRYTVSRCLMAKKHFDIAARAPLLMSLLHEHTVMASSCQGHVCALQHMCVYA